MRAVTGPGRLAASGRGPPWVVVMEDLVKATPWSHRALFTVRSGSGEPSGKPHGVMG